jgi:hypothetical protein
VKVPFSAAGRDRFRRRGPLDEEHKRHADRLLSRFGSLLFEPWMKRTYDAGIIGLLEPEMLHIMPPHKQTIDSTGICRNITVGAAVADTAVLTETAHEVGRVLWQEGYLGPFSVDAYGYEGGFQRLSEINARMSFGLLAHAQSSSS